MLLSEMETFYWVARLHSFTKAAEKLQSSKSFVSKKITRLENDLKTKLLNRSTRQLSLTEAGELFLQACTKMIESAETGLEQIAELRGKPTGIIRISAPPAFGVHLLAPFLAKFSEQYPHIKLDIHLENQLMDIIQGGYDVAIRSAKLDNSDLIAQPLIQSRPILVASPAYFAQHGEPKSPKDLFEHTVASYSFAKERRLLFSQFSHQENIRLQSNIAANHLDFAKMMAVNGSCIAILPQFMAKNEIKSNTLKACLTAYRLPSQPIYAIYPERRYKLPKISLFLTALKQFAESLNPDDL